MPATYVYEVMNPELYAVSPERPARSLIAELRERRITSAPVVDRSGYPLGLISLHDLAACESDEETAGECMSGPAVVVEAGVTLAGAARLISAANLHRLVAIDELGRAIGMVSSIDLLRGLTGQPATHPWPFTFRQRDSVSAWSSPEALAKQAVQARAPAGSGVLILLRRKPGRPDTVVWAEATRDVRGRLTEILEKPQPDPLAHLVSRGDLAFRCVETPYRAAREAALRSRGV